MSDKMTPMPFGKMMEWILEEHEKGSIFGIRKFFKADPQKHYEIFGRRLETPFGPAAGPHTQLAQNIVAAYLATGRSSPSIFWTVFSSKKRLPAR